MNTIQSLTGSALPVAISKKPGYHLQAPGLHGQVFEVEPAGATTRATAGEKEQELQQGIERAEMHQTAIFEIAVQRDDLTGKDQAATRAAGAVHTTRGGESAMVLTTPRLTENMQSVVLYTDDAGVSRWVFTGGTDAAGNFTFYLPRSGAPAPPEPEEATRGPISFAARRVVRVLSFLSDDIVGLGAQLIAQAWENKHRPYGFYTATPGAVDSSVSWSELQGKRALLLIHGTTGIARSTFHGLVNDATNFAALRELYGNRIIAFNHPSLHHNPAENIRRFFKDLPANAQLNLDVITHSRGGLVGRELMERTRAFDTAGHTLKFGKAIFVGTPHRGTILADGKHWMDFIDRMTNLLNAAPDNTFVLAIEGILSIVKIIASGALSGLPGLEAMLPSGDYLKRLNDSHDHGIRYHAITARYRPHDENLLRRFVKKAVKGHLIDKIFGEDNDGVVPTEGCFDAGSGAHGFPIPKDQRAIFQLEDNVHHTSYFQNSVVNRKLVEWLR